MSNKLNIIFTGQGSQFCGMLAQLTENKPHLLDKLSLASEILGYDLSQIDQDEEKINLTEYAQPIIFTFSSILIDTHYEHLTKKYEISNIAGHSLGEYLALYFSGVADFETMLKIVSARGRFMSKYSDPDKYGMLALINKKGINLDQIVFNEGVYPANFNSEGQVVVCGLKKEFDKFIKENSAIARFIPLKVSAPFHSPIMKNISRDFQEYLQSNFTFSQSKFSVVSNHGQFNYFTNSPNEYIKQLSTQLYSPVVWTQTIKNFNLTCKNYLEIGPKKTLLGFLGKDVNQNFIDNVSLDGNS